MAENSHQDEEVISGAFHVILSSLAYLLMILAYLFIIFYYGPKLTNNQNEFTYMVVMLIVTVISIAFSIYLCTKKRYFPSFSVFVGIPATVYLIFFHKWESFHWTILGFTLAGLIALSFLITLFKNRRSYKITSLRKMNNNQEEIEKLIQENSEGELENSFQPPAIITKSNRKRIVILLPLKDENDDVKNDVRLICDGFGNALHNFSEKMALVEVDFRFYGHNHSDTNIAEEEDIIKEELLNGTEYFICTTSPTSKLLSDSWERILSETNCKGILLCTVASLPEIKTIPNKVYRLFMRADEECRFLVDEIKRLHPNFEKASMIYFDTPYAEANAGYFKKYWGSECNEGLKLFNSNYDSIGTLLKDNSNTLKNKDLIFIAGTWNAITRVFPHLNKFKDSTFIVPSAFKPEDRVIHEKFKVITCYPNMSTKFYGSIVTFFTEITLIRLIDIISTPNFSIEHFHDAWLNCKRPKKLIGQIEFSTDTLFPLVLRNFLPRTRGRKTAIVETTTSK